MVTLWGWLTPDLEISLSPSASVPCWFELDGPDQADSVTMTKWDILFMYAHLMMLGMRQSSESFGYTVL